MNQPEISEQFRVHKLNERGMRRANELAEHFTELLTFIESLAVDGREMSIVRTKLEEASFFAKKAMAMHPENQQS